MWEHLHAHLMSLVSALVPIMGGKKALMLLLSVYIPAIVDTGLQRLVLFLLLFKYIFEKHSSSLCHTAQPYNAEFYFDTPNPVRILKGNNYSYNLQWTQKDPEATDRIIGYWVNVRKVNFLHTHTHTPINKPVCSTVASSYISSAQRGAHPHETDIDESNFKSRHTLVTCLCKSHLES